MGGYVVYNIATRDALFGRNIADNDKGLIIILAILALIMAHYFVAFWMSKREYYSPSSLRDATYDDVIKARSLLTKHSPQRLSNKDQWAASINDLSPLVDKIPLGFGRDEFIKVMGLYTKCSSFHFARSFGVQKSDEVDKYVANIQELTAKVTQFFDNTEWVFRK